MTKIGDVKRKLHGKIWKKPDNFSWLIEGKLAGSAIPTSTDEVEWAIEQGVKSIVTVKDLVKTVDFIHNRITSNEPVMVHCLAGLGRTGTMLACYLIKHQKMSADEAIQKVREERPGSIQSYPQEEIIFQFAKSLQS